MSVVLRVDGSKAIGMGHLYRCSSIADYLTRKSLKCRFVTETPSIIKFLNNAGYECVALVHKESKKRVSELIQTIDFKHAL